MPRATRLTREKEAAAGIVPSPLKFLPTDAKAKKPRGNATEKRIATSSEDDNVVATSSKQSRPQSIDSQKTSNAAYNLRSISRSVSPGLVADHPHKVVKRAQKAAGLNGNAPARRVSARKTSATTSKTKASAPRTRSRGSSTDQSVDPTPTQNSSPMPGTFPTEKHLPSIEEANEPSTPSVSRKRARESSPPKSVEAVLPSSKRQRNENYTPARAPYKFFTSPVVALQALFSGSPKQPTPSIQESPERLAQDDTTFLSAREQNEQSTPRLSAISMPPSLSHQSVVDAEPKKQDTTLSTVVEEQRAVEETPAPARTLPNLSSTCPQRARSTVAEDFGFKRTPQSVRAQRNRDAVLSRSRPIILHNPIASIELNSDDESIHGEDLEPLTQKEISEKGRQIRSLRKNYEKGLAGIFSSTYQPTPRVSHTRTPKASVTSGKEIIQEDSIQDTEPEPEQGPAPSSSRPSMTISGTDLIIPATASGERIVLTDTKFIDVVRSIAQWAMSSPTNKLPSPQQMTAFLEQKNAPEIAAPIASTPDPLTTTIETFDDVITDHVSDNPTTIGKVYNDDECFMSGALAIEDVVANGVSHDEIEGEQEIERPQTPTQEAAPAVPATPSRGWLSAAKNLVSTPLRIFGRTQQAADATPVATPTHARAESEFTFKHASNVPNLAPVSPTRARALKSALAQTERKPKTYVNHLGIPILHPRHVHFAKDFSVPFEKRGLATKEQIKAIQDEQDKQARSIFDDFHASERQRMREAVVEKESESYSQPKKHKTKRTRRKVFSGQSDVSYDDPFATDSEESDEEVVMTESPSKPIENPFSSAFNSDEDPTRVRPYTGVVFRQPDIIQYHINNNTLRTGDWGMAVPITSNDNSILLPESLRATAPASTNDDNTLRAAPLEVPVAVTTNSSTLPSVTPSSGPINPFFDPARVSTTKNDDPPSSTPLSTAQGKIERPFAKLPGTKPAIAVPNTANNGTSTTTASSSTPRNPFANLPGVKPAVAAPINADKNIFTSTASSSAPRNPFANLPGVKPAVAAPINADKNIFTSTASSSAPLNPFANLPGFKPTIAVPTSNILPPSTSTSAPRNPFFDPSRVSFAPTVPPVDKELEAKKPAAKERTAEELAADELAAEIYRNAPGKTFGLPSYDDSFWDTSVEEDEEAPAAHEAAEAAKLANAEREKSAREKAAREKLVREKIMRERAQFGLDQLEEARREKAEREKIIREKAQSEKDQLEKAQREKIMKDQLEKAKRELEETERELENAEREAAECEKRLREGAQFEQDLFEDPQLTEMSQREIEEREEAEYEKAEHEKAEREKIARENALFRDPQLAGMSLAEIEEHKRAEYEEAERERIARENALCANYAKVQLEKEKAKRDMEKLEGDGFLWAQAEEALAEKARLEKEEREKAKHEKAEKREKAMREKVEHDKTMREKTELSSRNGNTANGKDETALARPISSWRNYHQSTLTDVPNDEHADDEDVESYPTVSLLYSYDGSSESLPVLNDGSLVENTTDRHHQPASNHLQVRQFFQSTPQFVKPTLANRPQPSAATLAAMNKYTPIRPSHLRNVENMSPLELNLWHSKGIYTDEYGVQHQLSSRDSSQSPLVSPLFQTTFGVTFPEVSSAETTDDEAKTPKPQKVKVRFERRESATEGELKSLNDCPEKSQSMSPEKQDV